MKRLILVFLALFLCFGSSAIYAKDGKVRVILLISEQNIEGPQRAWWASEINLSAIEASVAKRLIGQGYEVLEPSNLSKIIKQDKAFSILNISEEKTVKLGNLAEADYAVLGKGVASSGGKVPQSNMVSCFANVTAKLIRVKDGKVIAYLDAGANSAHLDAITGGKETLSASGEDLAGKLLEALVKEGDK